MRHDRAFSSWFGNSVVVDNVGSPLALYHSTTDPWFVPAVRYGMGPHFCDLQTARERMEQRICGHYSDQDEGDLPGFTGAIFAAYLRIERPVFMWDVHFDELPEFALGIIETEILSLADVEAICGKRDGWYATTQQQNGDSMGRIVARLIECGYDGIAYRNNIEGAGTLSWIPFTLRQIWEVPENPSCVDIAKSRCTTGDHGSDPPRHLEEQK